MIKNMAGPIRPIEVMIRLIDKMDQFRVINESAKCPITISNKKKSDFIGKIASRT